MPTKLKILQINKFYYLKGGCERYMFGLSKLLEQNGHKVIVFSMQDEKNKYSEYAEYFAEPVAVDKFCLKNIVKFFYNYEAAGKLEQLIVKEKPDIAHLHNIAHQLSPSIIYVLKKYNIPIVQTLHDYKLICPNYRLFSQNAVCSKCQGKKYYHCFFKKCFNNSYGKSFLAMIEAYLHNKILKSYDKIDYFIAPSRFMKDICVQFGVPSEKIKVIYNFIDPPLPALENYQAGALENSYLLYFGRIAKEKGIDVLIKSLMKTKNKAKLIIVGAGPEFKELSLMIKKLKLADQIKMTGPKYGNELSELISQAKAIVIPSIWPENMPLSLLEAMALGKIVIASRIGGLPEIIEDGGNGLLFTAGDSDDLAAAIDKLNRINLAKISNKAKEKTQLLNSIRHYQVLNEEMYNFLFNVK